MSSDEEFDDELADLEDIRDQILSQPRADRMQVSAWEEDDGIDAERNPKG